MKLLTVEHSSLKMYKYNRRFKSFVYDAMSVCGTKHPTKQHHIKEDLNVHKICDENFISRLVYGYISFPFFLPLFRICEEAIQVVIAHEHKT
jgi:hypothetical protein